ncbi:MAG: hypothetical protein KGI47_03315 [Betaproteobacteria bacterium]|nr:hypothetical protein [Betaproteobacteria bacterium]
MSANSGVYRFNALAEDYPDEVESIRQARARIEAETEAQLAEQARLRAEAQARSVAPSELLVSREQDLRRLEREHLRAENQAIAAVERRMEAELRAIEADNERILLEAHAEEAAEARCRAVEEALNAARDRIDEEVKATVAARQRGEAESRAREAAAARREAQAALVQKFQQQEALDQAMTASQRQALQAAQESVTLMELQRAASRGRLYNLLLGLTLAASWAGFAGMVAWGDPALFHALKTILFP